MKRPPLNEPASASPTQALRLCQKRRGLLDMARIFILAGFLATPATAQTLPLPGGLGDDSAKTGTYYVGEPTAATAPATAACRLVNEYLDLINSKQVDRVVSLFTPDAQLYEPAHFSVAIGETAISQFFTRTIGPMSPHVIPVDYLSNDHECAVELALKIPGLAKPRYALVSIDHFTLAPSGKFSRMIAFARPLPQEMLPAARK